MSAILQKIRGLVSSDAASSNSTNERKTPKMPPFSGIVRTSYSSLPVPIPDSFLAPLPDPSTIKVSKIDFANTKLNEYEGLYAVVLDDVLSKEECDQLIHMAEMSAGAHQGDEEVQNNGWRPAMVNAGRNHEVLALEYRNSDRIIWDQNELAKRLWERVLQGEGMREYLSVLDGKEYARVCGGSAERKGERWVATPQGLNERLRFLKYGAGQFFRKHCDGAYETEDGSQRSFYTIHLYLNDSAQALGIPEGKKSTDTEDKPAELLRGGATTFHSIKSESRLDVDPKAGRVLIFQHRSMMHSGDDVTAGIKYTMRSDLMYQFETDGKEDADVVFNLHS